MSDNSEVWTHVVLGPVSMLLLLSILANLGIHHADPAQLIGGEPPPHTHTLCPVGQNENWGHLGLTMGFSTASDGKESACDGGDWGLIPG